MVAGPHRVLLALLLGLADDHEPDRQRQAPGQAQRERPGGPAEITQNVRYLNSFERHDYIIRAVGGNTCGLTDHNGTNYDTQPESTEFSGEGWAIFVMDQKDVIYAGTHVLGIFHHSSFLAGAPVKSAGEMIVNKGVLRVLTGKSGHYKPGPEETRRMLAVLIAKNCVAKTAVVKPFQQPWCNAIQWYNAGPTGTVTPATRAEVLSQIPAPAQSKIFSLELPPSSREHGKRESKESGTELGVRFPAPICAAGVRSGDDRPGDVRDATRLRQVDIPHRIGRNHVLLHHGAGARAIRRKAVALVLDDPVAGHGRAAADRQPTRLDEHHAIARVAADRVALDLGARHDARDEDARLAGSRGRRSDQLAARPSS